MTKNQLTKQAIQQKLKKVEQPVLEITKATFLTLLIKMRNKKSIIQIMKF